MKNKTAKFIALLLAVFIFPLSFSACKSGNTELSAESVADICIENRQVWEFGENSVGNCGYCFIDLDFDGMPELVSTSTQGSGLFTTDFFYKINAEKSAVESLPLSGNGNADFKLNAAQDGDYMKLLRDGDGNMFYFFCSYARASAGNYAVSYSRVTVSGGKVQSSFCSPRMFILTKTRSRSTNITPTPTASRRSSASRNIKTLLTHFWRITRICT